MHFLKMHGLGNDYIYVDCLKQKLNNPSKYAKLWSDRHFGIGADGLVLILPSLKADAKMDIYNSDGSKAEMCGNAIRCVGKYLYENNILNKKNIKIETLSGIKDLYLNVNNNIVETVKVNMGIPIFNSSNIPVDIKQDRVINFPLTIDKLTYNITCVSMGNPHAVLFVDDDLDTLEIENIGKTIENNNLFPNRINVEFINIIDESNIRMRVWERGAGETLACGTGACAAVAASVENGYTKNSVNVHLLGGDLFVEWDNYIYMTGTATKVFKGEIEIH